MFCKQTEEILIVGMGRISEYATDETAQEILNISSLKTKKSMNILLYYY